MLQMILFLQPAYLRLSQFFSKAISCVFGLSPSGGIIPLSIACIIAGSLSATTVLPVNSEWHFVQYLVSTGAICVSNVMFSRLVAVDRGLQPIESMKPATATNASTKNVFMCVFICFFIFLFATWNNHFFRSHIHSRLVKIPNLYGYFIYVFI